MPLQSLLFNSSGGLSYHWRARRYRNALWLPFINEIQRWLTDCTVLARLKSANADGLDLVVIGSSAGYCWLGPWVSSFRKVEVYEPDPLARVLLRRRLVRQGMASSSIAFGNVAELTKAAQDQNVGSLAKFLNPKNRFFLFTNILGQLVFLNDDSAIRRWKNQVRHLTGESSFWASFHDRVSGRLRLKGTNWPIRFQHRVDDDSIAKLFEIENDSDLELLDHETEGYFVKNIPHAYFHWNIIPGRHHLIEAVTGL